MRCDKRINSSYLADHIQELNLLVVILGIGIDDAGEQLSGCNLLHIGHPFHDVDGDHAVECAAQIVDFVIDAVLDTDSIKNSALTGMHLLVGIDHLNEEAHDSGLLCIVKNELNCPVVQTAAESP